MAHGIRSEFCDCISHAETARVYRASEVDKRIAELEALLRTIRPVLFDSADRRAPHMIDAIDEALD